ncbi:winged helix-turn-helix transcriptional regulator [Ralstonia pseudosolanacearum]|uniref:winged helix-turn-helix transcriptional regulator n=1 Tax=Ralstonia pseudosolanacearum TaxID=1310165 RepID=UPI001E62CE50|nr:helix-turn-helix domain-containing protein [Ralstonia pseudosolanacearum]
MPDDTDLPACGMDRINEIRLVLDQVANKWSIMILTILCEDGPTRFNAIKRRLGDVTHKSLADALRRLERFGLIRREVISSSPVAVQYEITELGKTLEGPITSMLQWSEKYSGVVLEAQRKFDEDSNLKTIEPIGRHISR